MHPVQDPNRQEEKVRDFYLVAAFLWILLALAEQAHIF